MISCDAQAEGSLLKLVNGRCIKCTVVIPIVYAIGILMEKPLKIHEGMCLSEDGATWTGTMSLDFLVVT